ncbi:two-component system response regulator YesN [Paenibacillus taihuensis]|uniref:Two-component system response regulator YesN n=1 Tax=Paenibacillus taihuensis TaxID=1156355 RepID=A0A3D9RIL3_9BACL|nr:response regulator transcription factor [Paenibacillus taihuensis]REE78938.1 two-component system response regulator YesN [Paenibacillus taihuensis]
MYKVLITDDEPMIREGLRTLIEWEELGFQVVDTAANGKEALQKAERYSPDLMIIDIRMPGMTGLEVIETLRKKDESVHVLILSGYADFDYAKKAIALSIDGYLLKPVEEDELVEYLQKLKSALDKETDLQQRQSEQVEWNMERTIQAMLTSAEEQLPVQEGELAGAGLLWDGYNVALIRLQHDGKEAEPSERAAFKKRLCQVFDEKGRGTIFISELHIGLLLKENLQFEQVRKAVYKEIEALAAELLLEATVSAGGRVKRFSEINRSYEEALKLLKQRFFYEGNQLITQATEPVCKAEDCTPAPVDQEECADIIDKMYFALDIGNEAAIDQLVTGTGHLFITRGCSEQVIKSLFVQILTGVLGKMSQHDADVYARSGQVSVAIMEIYQLTRYSAMERHVIQLLKGLNASASQGDSADKLMRKMIDLIQRNYDENLKLESLADVFNYNSAYLGKLFKNTTGEYFNTYLDKVRIEKAKEFLGQGMKVYQVAEKVGYANVDYFHAKFRKYVGSSPSGFRKK